MADQTVGSFGRKVLGWSRKVYKLRDEVFRTAFMRLADEMQASCPKDTHFLMSSLDVGKNRTPRMTRPNPRPSAPPGSFSWDRGQIVGVVESAVYGEKLYLGYTAAYAAYVHDGHHGVSPRPWVALTAQRWRSIVQEVGREVRARA